MEFVQYCNFDSIMLHVAVIYFLLRSWLHFVFDFSCLIFCVTALLPKPAEPLSDKGFYFLYWKVTCFPFQQKWFLFAVLDAPCTLVVQKTMEVESA